MVEKGPESKTIYSSTNRLKWSLVAELLAVSLIFLLSFSGYFVLSIFNVYLNYNLAPWTSLSYLAAWSLVTIIAFRRRLAHLNIIITPAIVISIISLHMFLILFYGYFISGFTPPTAAFSEHPGASFLNASLPYVLIKSLDLALQATLLWLIANIAFRLTRSLVLAAAVYGALFAIVHAILVLAFSSQMITIFTGELIGSTLLFPYLLIRVRAGIVGVYALQWLFQAALTYVFWT